MIPSVRNACAGVWQFHCLIQYLKAESSSITISEESVGNDNANVSTIFAYSSSTAQETKRSNKKLNCFIFYLFKQTCIYLYEQTCQTFLNCKISLQMLVTRICIRINNVGQVVSPNPFCLLVWYQSLGYSFEGSQCF